MICLQKLSKDYSGQSLFSDVSLQFNTACRYGVIGANGVGKTTLLRIVSGTENATSGHVVIPNGLRVGVLDQNQLRYADQIILDTVLQGNQQLWSALQARRQLLETTNFRMSEVDALSQIDEELEKENVYSAEGEAASILDGLGIPVARHQETLQALSGGYRLRVLLARLLFSKPDILLLDEPTNHLDIYTIQWLEQYLSRLSALILVVSHDYEFLNQVCTHIANMDYGNIKIYKGNYDDFLYLSQDESERRTKEQELNQRKAAELRRFIDRFRAKASKATQAQSRVKQLAKLTDGEKLVSSRRNPHFRFSICRPSGVEPLKINQISKAYGQQQVLDKVSFQVARGEKIAIIGPNGIGKSTLLKIIANQLSADQGQIEWGYETWPVFFPQDFTSEFMGNETAFEWLSKVDTQANISAVRAVLGALLFSGDEVSKKTAVLSGGERSRLLIGRIMLSKHNFLILDEPTNHLDLASITALKEALLSYEGTVLLVSHNRYLVSAVANRIIEINLAGLNTSSELNTAFGDLNETAKIQRATQKDRQRRQRQLMKSVQEQEDIITALEQKKADNNKIILDYTNFVKMSGDEQRLLCLSNEEIELDLQRAMGVWEDLQTELEAFSATNDLVLA